MSRTRTSLETLLRIIDGHSYRPSIKDLLFSKDIVKVACIGKLHSGKSSLLNQIIGKALLPSGMAPNGVTSFPIFVHKGNTDQVIISLPDGDTKSFVGKKCWEETAKFLCKSNDKCIPYIRVELPKSSQVPTNMLLVDLPGLDGSPWAEYDFEEEYNAVRCNHWVLSFVDIVLFCCNYRDLCTQEREIIQPYDAHKILVITHCDTYHNEEDDKSEFYDFEHNHGKINEAFDKLRKLVTKNSYSTNVVNKLHELKSLLEQEKFNYQKRFIGQLIDSFREMHKSIFNDAYFVTSLFQEDDAIPYIIGHESLSRLKDKLQSIALSSKGSKECFDSNTGLELLDRKIKALIHNLDSASGMGDLSQALSSELAYAKLTGFFSKKMEALLKKAKTGHL